MKLNATVVACEKLGKSEYSKFWAVYPDRFGGDRMAFCICHSSAMPDVCKGDVVEVVPYRSGNDNRFEFV